MATIFQEITLTDVILIVAAIVVGFASWRTRSVELWKSNYEAERTRTESIRQRLTEKEAEFNSVQAKVIALEQRPDYTTLLATQQELFQTVKEHHQAEMEIWTKVTAALDIVVGRLNE